MWRKYKKEKMNPNLIIACPKGRLEKKVVKYLADRGLEMEKAFFDDEIRKLTFNTNFKNIKVIKLKPSDIRSYTILGAADIGFVGYDDILENSSENIVLLQKTSIGKCRISIASDRKKIDFSEKKVFKVATKFQNISERYFRELNIQTETIKLNGSIELAVKYRVADFILDLVQSGQTLKDNQLYENVIINNDISTVIISSYYAYDTKKVFKVATKFQNISEQYFRDLNIQTETIKLNGSIELAVKYGVADFILDLVQSGKTLKDNQLYENVIINNDISTVIISSYYAYDTKKVFIKKLLTKGL